jgi:hypothetical protein
MLDDAFPLALRSGFPFQPNLSPSERDINVRIRKPFADGIGDSFCCSLVCITKSGRWCLNKQTN